MARGSRGGRPAPRARAPRRRRQASARHPSRRQPVEHLSDRRRGAKAHRFRPCQGARSHRVDGDRRHQGQTRLPGAGAGPRALGRPAGRRLRPWSDSLGGVARPQALPRRQRCRDRSPRSRCGGAEPRLDRRRLPGCARRRARAGTGEGPGRALPDRGWAARRARRVRCIVRAARRRGEDPGADRRALRRGVAGVVGAAHRRRRRPPGPDPCLGRRRPEDDVDERVGRGRGRRVDRGRENDDPSGAEDACPAPRRGHRGAAVRAGSRRGDARPRPPRARSGGRAPRGRVARRRPRGGGAGREPYRCGARHSASPAERSRARAGARVAARRGARGYDDGRCARRSARGARAPGRCGRR